MKKNARVLVIIDNREKALMDQWKALKSEMPYEIATASLHVGDVWLCKASEPMYVPPENLLYGIQRSQDTSQFPPTPTIVIERKTISDLNASYGDGRYRDQKMRLINCEAPHVVMLVEGYVGKRSKNTTERKRLLSTFCNSMFRDGLNVYHTSGVSESVEWIEHTCQQMCKGKLEVDTEQRKRTKYTDVIKMSKKANLTPHNALELQLATIPGMSAKMARNVVKQYPTMMDLCQALEWSGEPRQLLKDVLGPVRSERVYAFLAGV